MTSSPHPARRLVTLIAVLASALVLAVAAAQAADQRLHDADANLEKAAVLLQAALAEQDPQPTKQRQAQYDRAVSRAIAHASKAREEIAKAIAIADS
jgi:hypothetical protein